MAEEINNNLDAEVTESLAKCPYFRKCGGCLTQHIPYDVQLENKKKQVMHLLSVDEIKVIAKEPYNYRNRMDFIFHKGGLGFRKKGDWKTVVDIESCAISDERINVLLQEVRTFFTDPDYFDLQRQTGTLKYAVIRVADESSISFVLNSDSTTISTVTDQIESFAKQSLAENILVTYVSKKQDLTTSDEYYVVKGKSSLTATYGEKKLDYSIQGFFQNNHGMAKEMHSYVTSLFEKTSSLDYHLLDLYGGVGAFGIMNAHLFKSVLSVESVKLCTTSALENAKNATISNFSAITKDAKQVASLPIKKPFMVITDPPRSGMHRKTISFLNDSFAKKIVYVSCNKDQLAKELKYFTNYIVSSVAICDLFPQTNHMEVVVELDLKE